MRPNHKPPLGITPRDIREEQYAYERAVEIYVAVARYRKAGRAVPPEWWSELADHQRRYPLLISAILKNRPDVQVAELSRDPTKST